ncbi:unnamed protein product [Didymodactylos carnosus]|uniref:Phospholipase A1 n=1 Tax=Didymodactylos carnosus TaxID=1234261 RepID=A0A813Q311_9BILA|nr:unnamed protein product [Didymodactylos carnosus]CAF0890278.1 unnamed protein product [Didymodactylos carnosus]CAF3542149.1 unnamed protein product [Didymodactylos carnosus]CAF3672703.1 unnamed protein product [Didymodactylos carnosus]
MQKGSEVDPKHPVNNNELEAEYDFANDDLPVGKTIRPHKLATSTVDLAYRLPYKQDFAGKELNLFGNELMGAGWQIAFNSSESIETNKCGYKAVVWVNHTTKEVHIASAGTLIDVYDVIDDLLVATGHTPSKFVPAKAMLEKVTSEFNNEYTISTSGHSLGAFSSNYTIILAKLWGRQVGKSTTFESPGFDHQNNEEAEIMEKLEAEILRCFAIDSPY